jgi:hypothetical protein
MLANLKIDSSQRPKKILDNPQSTKSEGPQ